MPLIQARAGKPIAIPLGEICRLICCDCGLVHDFVVERAAASRYTITFSRNTKATQQKRTNRKRSKS